MMARSPCTRMAVVHGEINRGFPEVESPTHQQSHPAIRRNEMRLLVWKFL
jgi:hypothetical protein